MTSFENENMCNTLIADLVINSYDFSHRNNNAVEVLHYVRLDADEDPVVVLRALKTIYFPDLPYLVKEGEYFKWVT